VLLVDANLLLYAYDSASPFHPKAQAWLGKAFSGTEPIRFAWVSILAFLRISTAARAFMRPLTPVEAAALVDTWLALPQVGALDPGEHFWSTYQALIGQAQARGPMMTDAFLAALAIEFGAVLCSTDQDFTRFRKLRLLNPLI